MEEGDARGNNIQSERGVLKGKKTVLRDDESTNVGDMLHVQIISTLPKDENIAQLSQTL
jgi:hypothetical protein